MPLISKLTFLVILSSNGLLASVSAEERQHTSEEVKARNAELIAAEADQHLAEELAKMKATESKAMLNEKAARVEEAKADLKIEISKEKGDQKEEVSAVAKKDEAKEDEKANEVVVEKAKEAEKAVEAEEMKIENNSKQGMQDDESLTSLRKPLASNSDAFTWMGHIFFVVVFASIAICYIMYAKREQAHEAMNHISNFPMMVNFQKNEVDASTILFQKSPGFQAQFSRMADYEIMA